MSVRKRLQRGVTLVELVLGVGLFVLLAAMLSPMLQFSSRLSSKELGRSTLIRESGQFQTLLRARLAAVKTGQWEIKSEGGEAPYGRLTYTDASGKSCAIFLKDNSIWLDVDG